VDNSQNSPRIRAPANFDVKLVPAGTLCSSKHSVFGSVAAIQASLRRGRIRHQSSEPVVPCLVHQPFAHSAMLQMHASKRTPHPFTAPTNLITLRACSPSCHLPGNHRVQAFLQVPEPEPSPKARREIVDVVGHGTQELMPTTKSR
jgi:hypothetical protein